MRQLPYWVQYVQALAPAIVSVIAACIAGFIAWRQYKTAHYRLCLDMFEKRFAVYEATKNFLNAATSHGGVIRRDLDALLDGLRGAEFLFDGETRNFVMKVSDMGFKAKMARDRRELSPNHPQTDKLIVEEDILRGFQELQGAALEDKFRRYLDLSKAGLAAEHRWLRSLLGALKHKRAQTGTE
ncbi:MAG: hypothetical protein ACLP19_26065 [Xanthobacteraceae bacterium]